MISGERRQNCAILSTSFIMNARKLHAKRCAIGPSSRFFSEAPSETLKNKNTYCKTHDKISGSRWRMKPLPISLKKSTKGVVFLQARPKSLVRSSGLTEKKQYETMLDTTCTKILSRNDLVDPPRRLK